MTSEEYMRSCGEHLRQLGWDLTYADTHEATERQTVDVFRGFDGVIAVHEPLSELVFEGLKERLKIVCRFGLGYETVDLHAASARGICVTNTAGMMAAGVAEIALLLMLEAGRQAAKYDAMVQRGDWGKLRQGSRLEGKTVGIIGFGSIGRRLARYCSGFGCRILAYDVAYDRDSLKQGNATPVSLNELARQSDYVSVNCPLTPQTRHIVDGAFLEAMKPTAFFVNTSRGATVDEQALVCALKDGRIAGAGLDVFETEPLPACSELRGLDNVILLPHIASFTNECYYETIEDIHRTLKAFTEGKMPEHCLNPDYITNERIFDEPLVGADGNLVI